MMLPHFIAVFKKISIGGFAPEPPKGKKVKIQNLRCPPGEIRFEPILEKHSAVMSLQILLTTHCILQLYTRFIVYQLQRLPVPC